MSSLPEVSHSSRYVPPTAAAIAPTIPAARPVDLYSLEPLDHTAVVDQNGHSYNLDTIEKLKESALNRDGSVISLHTNTPISPSRIMPNFQLREANDTMDKMQEMVDRLASGLSQAIGKLDTCQAQLAETRMELRAARDALMASDRRHIAASAELTATRSELIETRNELRNTRKDLRVYSCQLASTQVDLRKSRVDVERERKRLKNVREMRFIDKFAWSFGCKNMEKVIEKDVHLITMESMYPAPRATPKRQERKTPIRTYR